MWDISAEKVDTGAPSLSPSADLPVATSHANTKSEDRTNIEITRGASPTEYLTGVRLYGSTAA